MSAPAVNQAAAALASIDAALRAAGVVDVCLYGSRARGQATPRSDWDFLLTFSRTLTPREYFTVRDEIAAAIGTTVSISSPQYAPASFIASIAADCVPVWSA